eukprot:IDg13208t1
MSGSHAMAAVRMNPIAAHLKNTDITNIPPAAGSRCEYERLVNLVLFRLWERLKRLEDLAIKDAER